MADDETPNATEPVDATEETKAPKEPRASVTLPVWALALVGVLAAGGIGYAIGNDRDDSRNLINPIADVQQVPGAPDDGSGGDNSDPRPFGPGSRGGSGSECPRPPGFDGPPGQDDGQGSPGGGELEGRPAPTRILGTLNDTWTP